MTFTQLARKALRSIGVVGQGQDLQPADLQAAFELANDMLDGWAVDRLTIFHTPRYVFAATSGKGSPTNPYTIGPGGDLDMVRPIFIDRAGYNVLTTNPDFEIPLTIARTADDYADISIKNLASALPLFLYYDPSYPDTGVSTGLGKIFLYPVPNGQQPIEIVLYVPTPLRQFPDLTTNLSFPPGYADALHYQLAKRCAVDWRKPMNAELTQLAIDTFAAIKRTNAPVPTLKSDWGVGTAPGYYDWRTGTMQPGNGYGG